MMSNTKKLLSMTALTLIAALANAQATQRSFTYSSSDAVDGDYSGLGNVALTAKTKVAVQAYLYISGNLGANWTVSGWGSGEDTKTETLRFYHNETLSFQLSNFADPAKVDGGTGGAQSVKLSGQLAFTNPTTSADLFDSGMVDIADLNSLFQASGPSFDVSSTGGLLNLDFKRKIQVGPTVGPGHYENDGVITVIRN